MTAVETTKETWFEAELHRTAGEIALRSAEHNAAKAEAYFGRALSVARQQQAKSWELRATMSLASLAYRNHHLGVVCNDHIGDIVIKGAPS
jgi:predicted ATPase